MIQLIPQFRHHHMEWALKVNQGHGACPAMLLYNRSKADACAVRTSVLVTGILHIVLSVVGLWFMYWFKSRHYSREATG